MKSKKSGAIKGLLAFLGVMAVLTFFSRTLYYGTLPKVETQRVNSGVLRHEISGKDYLLDAKETGRVEIPFSLGDAKIFVEQVHVQKYGQVKSGDALVSFDPVQCADAQRKADQAHQRAKEALAAWDLKYQAEWNKLDRDIAAHRKKLLEEKADVDALNAELKAMRNEQATLERMRMLDGVTRAEKEQALAMAQSISDAFSSLEESGWTLKAQNDYLVSDVLAKAGDEYAGLLPLIKYIPDGVSVRVGIECENKVAITGSSSVDVTDGNSVRSGNSQWTFSGESTRNGKRILWAEPIESLPDLNKLTGLTFRISSDYCQYLVPNGAVVNNSVFVLDSRFGAWGAEEFFARRVEIRGIQQDDKNTNIPMGLTGMDSVIVRWDRPLNDGDVVVMQLY